MFRSAVMGKKGRDYWLATQRMMDQSISVLQENLAGIHVVKAFASEDYESRKYAEKAAKLRDQHYRSERLQGTESSWMTLYFSAVLVGLFWYGGLEVIDGNISAGEFAMFLLLINQINQPIRMLPFMINSFARAATSGKRLFAVLDTTSPVVEAPDAKDMGRAEGHVRFSNVSFSYEKAEPALKNVEFSIPPGSVVALLGAPGSGKSTVVNLLPRFYDPTEGQITIDGRDIQDFTLASLRRNVGIVQQDVFLFGARVRDNIAYGADETAFEDIVKVAKAAQLHDHIISLPDGYDTWVGERGVTLSGGQRQRLSIARTILIDPPVLILDDSTSSVDVETERMIHRAMEEVMRGRTTFVIAHRLSTVREADVIMVLKDGGVVERGTHEELISTGGIYQDIYELQLKPQEDILMDATLVESEEEEVVRGVRQRENVTIDTGRTVTEGGDS
jgi:ATP-binding cassette subfamily B protein